MNEGTWWVGSSHRLAVSSAFDPHGFKTSGLDFGTCDVYYKNYILVIHLRLCASVSASAHQGFKIAHGL